MKQISIFNHVLGPVMRGPSSSHTAGAYHIASVVRSMLGATPARVVCAFDPGGSYAHTYAQQGADRAFAQGLMGSPLTDESFFRALELAHALALPLRLWKAQNACFRLAGKPLARLEAKARAGDAAAGKWVEAFKRLAKLLGVKAEE